MFHVASVGYDLYCKMLKEAVDKIRGEDTVELLATKVEAPHQCFFPDSYVQDPDERMRLYKRLARMTSGDELESFIEEVGDRFGDLPVQAVNLLNLTEVKLRAAELGISLVRLRPAGQGQTLFEFAPDRAFTPEQCARLVETFGGRLLFKAGKSFAVTLAGTPDTDLLGDTRNLLQVAYFSSTMGVLAEE